MKKRVITFKLTFRILAGFLMFYFIGTFNSYALVRLPKLVGDNMVLQRNVSLNIWGWADKGEKVTVKFLNQELTTVADKDGNWSVKLLPIKEGGPYEMILTGKNVIKLYNILIGDVWLCSGQSNMEMALKAISIDEARYEIENANYPMIHFLNIEKNPSYTPSDDVTTTGWTECKPQTVRNFSALGYFFGRELYKKYQIPIGLIEAAYGGSSAEQWTSAEGLKEFPEFDTDFKKYILNDKQKTEAKKKYESELKLWLSEVEKKDLAFRRGELWNDNNFDTIDWKKMLFPGLWTDNVLPGFDGIVWFRKELEITKQQAGKDLVLFLAQIIDKDRTWFNGLEVGALNFYTINRKYVVPGHLVKEGKNVITIRMISNSWAGGIWGVNDDIYALSGDQKISLAGEWLFKSSESTTNLPKQPEASYEVVTYPSTLYNSAIHPIQKYAIKGAIWYQGESNAGMAEQYGKLFPAMIADWRKQWGIGNFPFLFVQLANWGNGGNNWPLLREAQTKSLSSPNTGMALAIDIGDTKDIHPKNKKEVGRRLASVAMKEVYNENIICYGPMYQSMAIEGNKIRIKFNNLGSGLCSLRSEPLTNFTIAGDDKNFVPANAFLEGNSIVVVSDKVSKPVAVRYAWHTDPQGITFYNFIGFPAVPFRTDNWTEQTK